MIELVSTEVIERAEKIRLLICGVDGVLTNGQLFFTPTGDELKGFHARDGHGIKLVQKAGIETAVISGRRSTAVALRMESLGVRHVYQGHEHKLAAFEELIEKLGLSPEEACFIGDDLLDLTLLRRVGLAVAVADAHFTIQNAVHYTTKLPGGFGAVRELCDLILYAQDKLEAAVSSYH
jgi:3-deoxy-D-manno-octulosonate 8-phosphate phosphatase (KDO 8-P phosphatase)